MGVPVEARQDHDPGHVALHLIVHDTDLDGWGSAALLAHTLGAEQCALRPTESKDIRRLLLELVVGPDDRVWVLDVPAPSSWADLGRLAGRLTWVDHHMDSWQHEVPTWVETVLPSGSGRTTTIDVLGDRGLVPLADVRRLRAAVFGKESRWAAAFAGMRSDWPDVHDLAALIVAAVEGGELPEPLRPFAARAEPRAALVDAVLREAPTQTEDGVTVVHLADAHRVPLGGYSLAVGDRYPGTLTVLVHRNRRLYCGFRHDLPWAFDLLAHFRGRGLAPKGHGYVCHVEVGAERIEDEVEALRMEVEQRRRLVGIITWAERIREHLQPTLEQHGDKVHFRPGSTAFSMISLLPSSPQLGRGGLRKPERLAAKFDDEFERLCASRKPGRPTAEKRMQSHLIRNAQLHDQRMQVLNEAAADGTELYFVTDEVALPSAAGKIVCDLLAVRRTDGGWVPVAIELKTARTKKRLVEQLTAFAALVDRHADLVAQLASVRLGCTVSFDRPCEMWMVWPAPKRGGPEPHEAELAGLGIRVVGYRECGDGGWEFDVGRDPAAVADVQ